jgi:hypothetical protein
MYSIVAAHRCILLVQQIISEKGLKREKRKMLEKNVRYKIFFWVRMKWKCMIERKQVFYYFNPVSNF